MEHTENIPARLPESLISDALECGRDSRPGWAQRHDGWTPERIRAFLTALAQCGVVADAARAAGMSKQSAYAFRNSARGRGFDVAWRAAHMLSRKQLADELMSRALNGCVERIVREGEVVAERHRHDNRLAMSVLTRLDTLAASPAYADEAVNRAAEEFDEFVDEVCSGGENAAEFLAARLALDDSGLAEPAIIARSEEYLRTGSGTGWEADDREQGASGADLPAAGERPAPDYDPARPRALPARQVGMRKAAPVQAQGWGRIPRYDAPRRSRGSRRGRWADDLEPPADDLSYLSDEQLDARLRSHLRELIDFERLGIDPDDLPLRGDPPRQEPAPVADDRQGSAQNEWQPSTSSTLSRGEGSGLAIGEAGDPETPTPGSQPPHPVAAAAPIPSPEPRHPSQPEEPWVLGDDGLPVRMVNGKIPVRRRSWPLG